MMRIMHIAVYGRAALGAKRGVFIQLCAAPAAHGGLLLGNELCAAFAAKVHVRGIFRAASGASYAFGRDLTAALAAKQR